MKVNKVIPPVTVFLHGLKKPKVVEKKACNFLPDLAIHFELTKEEIEFIKKSDTNELSFDGGEHIPLKNLHEVLFRSEKISEYAKLRKSFIESIWIEKFAPWLANGSISARKIYDETKRHEKYENSQPNTMTTYILDQLY